MWTRTTSCAAGVYRHVSTRSCDCTNGFFQGREVDRLLLYRILAGGIHNDGILGGASLSSRVPIYGTRDAGRGLSLRLKDSRRACGISLQNMLPTFFTLRDNDLSNIVVAFCNVDDVCTDIFLKELRQ